MDNYKKSYHDYSIDFDNKTISMTDIEPIEFIVQPIINNEAIEKLAERLRSKFGKITIEVDNAIEDSDNTIITTINPMTGKLTTKLPYDQELIDEIIASKYPNIINDKIFIPNYRNEYNEPSLLRNRFVAHECFNTIALHTPCMCDETYIFEAKCDEDIINNKEEK